jgi:isoquinoline 1-oxidoreductase subunit beta
VNPDIVAAQLEGAVNYGLSNALYGKITVKKGRVVERNFNDYIVMRMPDAPAIDAFAIPSSERPRGIGEAGVPPIAPAVGNAIFALTGRRIRTLPFSETQL